MAMIGSPPARHSTDSTGRSCRGLAAPAGQESAPDLQARVAEMMYRQPCHRLPAAASPAAVPVAAVPVAAARRVGGVEPRLSGDRLSAAGSVEAAGSTRVGDRR